MSAQDAKLMQEIQQKLQDGVPKTRIAKSIGVHRNTISNWIDAYRASQKEKPAHPAR